MKIYAIQTGTVEIKKNQLIGKGPKALRLVNVLLGKSASDCVSADSCPKFGRAFEK